VANYAAALSTFQVAIFLHATGLFCAATSGFMCTIHARQRTPNSNEQKLMKYSRAFQRPSNEALLRTGTRQRFRRGTSVGSCGVGVLNAKSKVPVAEVGRSAATHAIDRSPRPG